EKALMAPSVSTSKRRARNAVVEHAVARAPAPEAPAPAAPSPMTLMDEKQRAVREAIKALHAKIAETSDDVGERFPEEARRMHEGETPTRSIRGRASLAEAKELWEEGIPVLPIPGLPDDRN
ncbi:MAG TPA: DUF1178 family protein, partial [Beijerinckiaceae bacterium]